MANFQLQIDPAFRQAMTAKKEQKNPNQGSEYIWDKLPDSGEFSFRVLPPDERGRFGRVLATHWNLPLQAEGDRHECPRITHAGLVDDAACEICDALFQARQFGCDDKLLEPMDAAIRAIFKITEVEGVLKSGKVYKPDDIIILQTSGDYNLRWLIEQMSDPDCADFINPYAGFRVKYSRKSKNDKWERKILPGMPKALGGSEEAANKRLDESAKIDLYKMSPYPDAETLQKISKQAKAILENARKSMLSQTDAMKNMAEKLSKSGDVREEAAKSESKPADDDIPFEGGTPVADKAQTGKSREDTILREAQSEAGSKRPAGAPDCYGDANVHDPFSSRCMSCAHQISCESKIENGQ